MEKWQRVQMRLQKKIESNTALKTVVISNPLKTGKMEKSSIKKG
jgi:hypothetical protein